MKFFYLPLSFAILFCACSGPKEDEPEKLIVSVKVARAKSLDLPQTVTASASIFPREQANVAARVAGPIRALRVKKGDVVRAGQVLALLENRDVFAQREEAQAGVADAEASLQKTVAGTVPTDLGRARGEVQTTAALLDQARKNLDRRRQLFDQGAVPQRDVLQSQTDLATAQANYDVARRALDLLEHQSGGQDIAIAKARVEQARARLSAASANLQYTDLRSPFAGTVTEQFQYPGDMAGPSTPTYTVMDLSSMTARAQVPEANAAAIHVGQLCSFHAVEQLSERATGKVTVVSRAVDPARRTVEVWCEISKPPALLRAGAFGTASIEVAAIRGAIVVPAAAIQVNEGTDTGSVFVVDGKHVAHKRDVQMGVRLEDQVEIRSGLNAGDLVVIEGGYGLPDWAQVRLPGEKVERPIP
jgi:multidrug efflux pump subunit AcrA (membrane-fusion protein)